ncbi:MAG: peptidoglycan glycosyltransferase [Lachnospiraceae bacterium]|nr:peptidoglycan glycosyltransferase [Lachnospiraceae bacterium]
MLFPNKVYHRRNILTFFLGCVLVFMVLMGRLVYLMVWENQYYSEQATDLHERERSIKADRGLILDRNGKVLASNRSVCTVSVVHNQITEPETVIRELCKYLDLSEEYVRKRVEKYSSMERIQSNVDIEIGDQIRQLHLDGVKVDEDYKRHYPYGTLASKVLGFTGSDNQGILGLEVKYDQYLQGTPGTILTVTDAKGMEVEGISERRIEPISGNSLQTSLDINIQSYATQLAYQVKDSKQADSVSIIVMDPRSGEILAMADVSEYDLNDPFVLPVDTPEGLSAAEKQNVLNGVWRNTCINDTYEPGSVFKIITAAAGLEEGVVTCDSRFYCPGYIIVGDRKIRCHKVQGHGSEDFVLGTMNSCNPVFISTGLSLGVDRYYEYYKQFGLLNKTGIDLPGEAGTIMHKPENMGEVELATVAFGQSFQITPIQMLATAASLVNGGKRITPHFGVQIVEESGKTIKLHYESENRILSEDTSGTLREILEQVVSEGTGKNGKVEGYLVGGKTATSQTLPRGSGRYIASFLGFAPADDPQVIAIAIVNNPKGIYYGGQVAAPIVRQLFENILPYLEVKEYNQ